MQYNSLVLCAAFAITSVFSHGVITEVTGANGVTMPGLTVVDGTPRDCPSAGCGAQDDTAIIRANEIGTSKASAMGRTKANGPVTADRIMEVFMGGTANNTARDIHAGASLYRRQLFGGKAFGGAAGGAGSVKTPAGTSETGVAAAAGVGASDGLPTCSDAGVVEMTMHQINQDGAGPFTAMVDATSGGTDPAAFKTAEVTQNVPGLVAGISTTTTTDFPVKVQMPQGMTCSGSVGGASNVCVVKMQNKTPAGPFGGAAAFTQSTAAKKRAIEYNLRKRRMARALKESRA
ncbi:hypothetical protein BJ875DRAFT_148590 [Amylocarpus encephaloides]|uniref:Cell surface protein n=1 Tax=Amylocarpus encephaloides TaxID=45428 RepID=A0A9P7YQX0_9HELO|nr:hypothetical protein BJ875DRAFT_148590 [Amylocarpus encephaloides]